MVPCNFFVNIPVVIITCIMSLFSQREFVEVMLTQHKMMLLHSSKCSSAESSVKYKLADYRASGKERCQWHSEQTEMAQIWGMLSSRSQRGHRVKANCSCHSPSWAWLMRPSNEDTCWITWSRSLGVGRRVRCAAPALSPAWVTRYFSRSHPSHVHFRRRLQMPPSARENSTPGVEPVFSRCVYSLLRSGPLGTTGELWEVQAWAAQDSFKKHNFCF